VRKLSIFVCFLALSANAVFATSPAEEPLLYTPIYTPPPFHPFLFGPHGPGFILFGGSLSYASQNTAINNPWNATSIGFMFDWYQEFSETLGLYFPFSLGFITGAEDNGVALDMSQYGGVDLNMLVGIGYKLPLAKPFTTVLGAGLYWGLTPLLGSGASSSTDYYAGGIGAGIGATFVYSFVSWFGIGANVNFAYSFINPIDNGTTMSESGFKTWGGVGLVFFYPEKRYP
jgi:hypothetical protein